MKHTNAETHNISNYEGHWEGDKIDQFWGLLFNEKGPTILAWVDKKPPHPIRAMPERKCLLGGLSKDIIDFGHGPLDF